MVQWKTTLKTIFKMKTVSAPLKLTKNKLKLKNINSAEIMSLNICHILY